MVEHSQGMALLPTDDEGMVQLVAPGGRVAMLTDDPSLARETSARFGVAENMNAFIMRNVVDALAASDADADATEVLARNFGLSATELPSTALGQGVTGLNSRPSYFLYHPPSFTNLDDSRRSVSARAETIGPPEVA